jgi:hypothetical protein
MSTNRQKSFLATLSLDNKPIGLISHPGNSVPVLSQKLTGEADVFYFRCTDDVYTLYIRSKGDYFGKAIGRSGKFFTCSASHDSETFKVVNKEGTTLTLDELDSDNEKVYFRTRSDERVNAEFIFLEGGARLLANGQVNITLDLHIIERNTPYLSDPDEI